MRRSHFHPFFPLLPRKHDVPIATGVCTTRWVRRMREQLIFWTANWFGDSKIKGRIDYDDEENSQPQGPTGCDFMAIDRTSNAEGTTPLGLKFPKRFPRV